MNYTYLLINFFTLLFPVILSFDKKVRFYKSWKFTWPGIIITGIVFLFWDELFTIKGVWSFNGRYITGINFFHLPIEEILFFFTVPFACMFIYSCLNFYIKWEMNIRLTRTVSNILIIFSLLILIFYHQRLYTAVTFGFLVFLVTMFQFIIKVHWLNRFYLAWLVSLVPFYIINGVLTALPVVVYNNAQNMNTRVGSIPFEDHFYLMALLLMNTGIFEYFKKRGGYKHA